MKWKFSELKLICSTISNPFAVSITVNSITFKSVKFSEKTKHILCFLVFHLEKFKGYRNMTLEKMLHKDNDLYHT